MRIARLTLAFGLFLVTIAILLLPEPDAPVLPQAESGNWRAAFAAPVPEGEMRLLFIGNSFTERNDLPGMVAGLLRAGGAVEIVRTRMVAAGGAQLHEHAANEELRADIAELGWTAVILQDFSTAALFETDGQRSAAAMADLAERATGAGARPILMSTWARRAGHALYGQRFEGFAAPKGPREMTEIVSAHYAKVASGAGAAVAPVGDVWIAAREILPHIPLHAPDGYHASATGTYLAALVIARTLGLDPRAAEWAPEGVDPGEAGQLRMLVASLPQ